MSKEESKSGHESFCWKNKLATYTSGKSCLKPEWKYDLLQAGLMQEQREDKGKSKAGGPENFPNETYIGLAIIFTNYSVDQAT
ncbi:hypothetical protein TURU_127714 [Turdus rufiventris]|nr:hypothetical protein TURU_127714 [Turdus rufiventris]